MAEEKLLSRRKIFAVFFAFLAFQLLFFPFYNNRFGNIAVPIFGTVAFGLTILVANLSNLFVDDAKKSKLFLTSGAFSVLCAMLSLFRGNMIDNILLSFLSLLWWVISYYLIIAPGSLNSLSSIMLIPLGIFNSWTKSSRMLISQASKLKTSQSKINSKLLMAVIGLIITIPVAAVVVLLLSSADPVFRFYVERFFSADVWVSDILWQIVWRIFFSVLALTLLAIYAASKMPRALISPIDIVASRTKWLLSPFTILSLTLSAILSLFLIIQVKFLGINTLNDLTAFGIPTFSEYVRRGFFELLFVTLIVYGVCGVGLVLYRNNKASKIHLYSNSLLVVLNILLAVSAQRRVSLYMLTHGLTHMRIYGTMFLWIVVLLLVTLLARYIINTKKLHLVELIGSSLIILSFSMANTDYILAHISPPTVNGEVDYNYLARLSADEAETWVDIVESAKKDTLPLLDKVDLTVEEKIKITRTSWAINSIYVSVGRLSNKYGAEGESELFGDYYFERGKNYTILDYNASEAKAYRFVKSNINFSELREIRKKFEDKATEANFYDSLPQDIYQFY